MSRGIRLNKMLKEANDFKHSPVNSQQRIVIDKYIYYDMAIAGTSETPILIIVRTNNHEAPGKLFYTQKQHDYLLRHGWNIQFGHILTKLVSEM